MNPIDLIVALAAFVGLLGGFLYFIQWVREVARTARAYLAGRKNNERAAAAAQARARFAAARVEDRAETD